MEQRASREFDGNPAGVSCFRQIALLDQPHSVDFCFKNKSLKTKPPWHEFCKIFGRSQ
jgi:hypothetical protein